MRPIALVLPLLLLAACVPEEPVMEEPPADACQSAGFQGLVGQPRAVLDRMLLPAGSRVIGPNDPVTRDYRPDRLNIEIGANDRIDRVACY